ncbi:hypothetical protein FACS189499_04630 [Clostridia bacterium]|nr:hypothetical protein FACS189499_04630 [Clostridia bacterium]
MKEKPMQATKYTKASNMFKIILPRITDDNLIREESKDSSVVFSFSSAIEEGTNCLKNRKTAIIAVLLEVSLFVTIGITIPITTPISKNKKNEALSAHIMRKRFLITAFIISTR